MLITLISIALLVLMSSAIKKLGRLTDGWESQTRNLEKSKESGETVSPHRQPEEVR